MAGNEQANQGLPGFPPPGGAPGFRPPGTQNPGFGPPGGQTAGFGPPGAGPPTYGPPGGPPGRPAGFPPGYAPGQPGLQQRPPGQQGFPRPGGPVSDGARSSGPAGISGMPRPSGPQPGQAGPGMRPAFSGGAVPGMRPPGQQSMVNGGPPGTVSNGSLSGAGARPGAPFPGGGPPGGPRPGGLPPGPPLGGPPPFGARPPGPGAGPPQFGGPQLRPPGPEGPPQFGAAQLRVQGYAPRPPSMGPPPPSFGGALGEAPGQPGQTGYNTMPPPNYTPAVTSSVLDQFEALTLGPSAPGQQQDPTQDPAYYPRPTGEEAAVARAPLPPAHPGNCSPRFMRLTVNAVPAQQAMRARFQLPFGAIVHPMAEPQDLPVIGLDAGGIVRCRRCRTYINPFVTWIDGGRRFQCNVCGMFTEVPIEYFCQTDANGQRLDIDQRPELTYGSVEYLAPQEYMVRPPMPPRFFFVLDVTSGAVASGYLPIVCQAIKDSLDRLPGGERTQIGFMTFDSTLHFYNLKSNLTQPQMVVVAEIDEPFLPMPDDLVVTLQESRSVVEALLDALPQIFAQNMTLDSASGPALQAAFLAMQDFGGKLLLFQHAVPSLGVGKIKNRDNAGLWNTDSEHKLRNPDDPFYKKFAAECSRVQIAVDIFALGAMSNMAGQPVYTDLASLAALPRYTCGHLYHYAAFNPGRDHAKLGHDLRHNLTRPTAWEAVMRIRCSKGLRVSNFHGHFFIRSSDLLALPQVDPDKAFAVQMTHEDNVIDGPVAYLQCALLYTSSNGERRIRVHTMAFPVVNEVPELFRAVDGGATLALLARLAVEKSLNSKLDDTRAAVMHKLAVALREYRLLYVTNSRGSSSVPHNKLIFPPTLRYLPVWMLGLLRTQALKGSMRDVPTDDRAVAAFEVNAASVDQILTLVYPAMYPVYDTADDWGKADEQGRIKLPLPIPLTMQAVNSAGAYLMDTGRLFVLWIGKNAPHSFYSQVFDVDTTRGNLESYALLVEPPRASELSKRINALLSQLRSTRSNYAGCFVVRQGTPPEQHVQSWFVEDATSSSPSYQDFANTVHKAVMAKV